MHNTLLALVLLVLGFLILIIEFLLPGFGLLGIIGILFIVWGCFVVYTKLNLFLGILTSILSIILVIMLCKIFGKKIFKKISLTTQQTKNEGYSSTEDFSFLLGKEGITLSALRPTGVISIENKRLNATTEGLFIQANKKVKVIKVEGNKIIVREV